MASNQADVQAINAAIQAEGLTWTAGQTDLTALTFAEQQQRLGVIVTPAELQRLAAERNRIAAQEQTMLRAGAFAAPAAVDWRSSGYVTSVKDQGNCGSCVSFGTCATIESAVRIKLRNPSLAIDLSEGFLQFCGGGSCSGWGLTSGLDFAKSTGVTDEACMPYQPTNMNCAASRCADWQNRLTKIASYTGVATVDARKNALATIGPVLGGMAVYNDFFAYQSGVYVKTAGSSLAGYHCISVVGYDDSQQCWIIKNSWAASWGEGGFCRIRYNQPDLLIDSSWPFYSVDAVVQPVWYYNVAVNMVYATPQSQNAWANFPNLGWRKIQTGAPDGVTNMLVLFAAARATGRQVSIYADGTFVYYAYML